MKTKKKTATKKVSKNRLLCVTLPETLLAAAQVYRKKSGFSSMSELLRAAVDKASTVAQKKCDQERKTQISFRLSDELYTSLFRASNQSGQSIARIIRTLLESAPKLGLRPSGMPVPKKRPVPAKKSVPAPKPASKGKSVPAKPVKKAPAKKTAVAKKTGPVSKPVAKKKPASAKSVKSAKVVKSVKKPVAKKQVPVKKSVPAKKSAVAKKASGGKRSSVERR